MNTIWHLVRRAAVSAGLVLAAANAGAQTAGTAVINPTDQLSFDRPESWAMKYFASAMLLTGLETPSAQDPGSVAVGLELSWLPSLTAAQRRVGFDGTKIEDLNKAPILPRPRVRIGLPHAFSLIGAGDPPIRAVGIKPKLLAVGLERPVYETPDLVVGVRGYGQIGSVQAAFTCPQAVLAFTPGSPQNTYGCQAESSDTASLRFAGGEASVAYRGDALRRLSPHAAIALNYFDMAFQVNALTFGYLDHTRLLAHGMNVAASGGVSYPLTSRLQAAVDLFYSPLSVRRSQAAPVQNDGLFNVRALVAYRFR